MADISRSRTAAAPPEAVWAVLSDFGAISAWVPTVDHSCLLEHGPDGAALGTTRRIQVNRDTIVERIIEFTPPTALAYSIEGLPRRLGRLVNRWTLIPAPNGYTVVTLTSTVDAGSSPVARLAERAVCRFMAKQSIEMLAGLCSHLEDSR